VRERNDTERTWFPLQQVLSFKRGYMTDSGEDIGAMSSTSFQTVEKSKTISVKV
jgi:hypothetical protein